MVAVAVLGWLGLATGSASAHTVLMGAAPSSVDVSASGFDVTLTFSEAINPKLAAVVVTGPGGPLSAAGPVRVVDGQVTLPLAPPAEPGDYRVRYRVVAADGHPVDGETQLTVTGPVQPEGPAPAPVEPETAATATGSGGGGAAGGLAVAAGAFGLLGLGAVAVRPRRGSDRAAKGPAGD